jgi:rSAM/selenodomain-associated transferase 2
MGPLLSIIVPALDEAECLPLLLDDLHNQQNIALEIIVGDGGSTDGTRSVAEKRGARCVQTEKGRGRQMNGAARTASGTYLLFLHADSRIDDGNLLHDAVERLQQESAQGDDSVAGHFRIRFIRTTIGNATAYRFAEGKTALNRPGTTNGDQGLLLTNRYFERLGGFDESLPFFEDQRIAEKIREQGKLITLPGELRTSARRFEAEGFHRRYILMSMMMGLYHAGVPEFLARAPGIYRTQGETGRLLLAPFFAAILDLMRNGWGVGGTVAVFYRIGRYIRQNSWQLFYFLDTIATEAPGRGNYPLLRFHDRFSAPLPGLRLVDAGIGIACFVWFMGVLAPYFRLRDRGNGISS